MSLFAELKRRNVFRVGIAYVVVAWLILQVSDVILNNIEAPGWVFQVIMLVLAIGFPLILLFAWAFELTPEGLKRDAEVDRSQSIAPRTGKKLEHVSIVALSLVAAFFLVREFWPDFSDTGSEVDPGTTVAKPPSIAVLPFSDYSENGDQEHFSRGIAEEILNLLAKTSGLRVAARTSSFAFAGSELDIREIGSKLDVGTVLEGSIRKSGNTIRVTAQLINIEDGYHLWSETYDRDYSDIFKIQDEIAGSILSSMKVHLLGEEAQNIIAERAHNMDAYSAYLIGKERMALRTRENIEAARGKFMEVIEIDPAYAPARVGLAHAWLLLERHEFGRAKKEDVDAVVIPQLEKALELAPDMSEAIAVRGLHHLRRYRYEEARADLDRAIQLSPNYALAYLWRSETFYEQARYLDMLADKEKAYALDPMSLDISSELAYDYGSFWRPRDADRIIARMFELHPGHPRAYLTLAANLNAHGRYGELLLTLEEALAKHPDNETFKGWYAWSLLYIGLDEQAEARGDSEITFWLYMKQGRLGKARELLEKGLVDYPEDRLGWLGNARFYHWTMQSEMGPEPFQSAVGKTIAYLDEENIPWREQCRPYLIYDMREAGVIDGVDEMMDECRKRTEERLKAKYLCPCSWYNLVLFAALDGRTEEAIERAREWLDNGDSNGLLELDPILMQWADRPEYAELLARNSEQVERQKQIYLAGVAARQADPDIDGP